MEQLALTVSMHRERSPSYESIGTNQHATIIPDPTPIMPVAIHVHIIKPISYTVCVDWNLSAFGYVQSGSFPGLSTRSEQKAKSPLPSKIVGGYLPPPRLNV